MVIAIENNRFINTSNIAAIRLEPKEHRAQLFSLHEGRLRGIGFAVGTAHIQSASALAKGWKRVKPENAPAPQDEQLYVREDVISEYRVIADDAPERIDIYIGESAIASFHDAQTVAKCKLWLSGGGESLT